MAFGHKAPPWCNPTTTCFFLLHSFPGPKQCTRLFQACVRVKPCAPSLQELLWGLKSKSCSFLSKQYWTRAMLLAMSPLLLQISCCTCRSELCIKNKTKSESMKLFQDSTLRSSVCFKLTSCRIILNMAHSWLIGRLVAQTNHTPTNSGVFWARHYIPRDPPLVHWTWVLELPFAFSLTCCWKLLSSGLCLSSSVLSG